MTLEPMALERTHPSDSPFLRVCLHHHHDDMRKQPRNSEMQGSARGLAKCAPLAGGQRPGNQQAQGCMDHQRGDPGLVTRPVTLRPTSNTGACVASSSTPTGSRPHRSSCVHVHPPWVAAVGLDACTSAAATASAPSSRCHPGLRLLTLDSSPAASPPHPPLLHLTHPHLLLLLLASIRSHSHPGRLNTFLAESGQR